MKGRETRYLQVHQQHSPNSPPAFRPSHLLALSFACSLATAAGLPGAAGLHWSRAGTASQLCTWPVTCHLQLRSKQRCLLLVESLIPLQAHQQHRLAALEQRGGLLPRFERLARRLELGPKERVLLEAVLVGQVSADLPSSVITSLAMSMPNPVVLAGMVSQSDEAECLTALVGGGAEGCRSATSCVMAGW